MQLLTMDEFYAHPHVKIGDLSDGDIVAISGEFSRRVDVNGECFTPWTTHQVVSDENGLFIRIGAEGRFYLAEVANPHDEILEGVKLVVDV